VSSTADGVIVACGPAGTHTTHPKTGHHRHTKDPSSGTSTWHQRHVLSDVTLAQPLQVIAFSGAKPPAWAKPHADRPSHDCFTFQVLADGHVRLALVGVRVSGRRGHRRDQAGRHRAPAVSPVRAERAPVDGAVRQGLKSAPSRAARRRLGPLRRSAVPAGRGAAPAASCLRRPPALVVNRRPGLVVRCVEHEDAEVATRPRWVFPLAS